MAASSKLEGSLKAVSGLKLPSRIGTGTKANTLKKPATGGGARKPSAAKGKN